MMTVNRILSDTVMVVVHCPDSDSYVLSHPPSGWSVPYSPCMQGSCRKEAASIYKSMLGANPASKFDLVLKIAFNDLVLKKTFRVWHMDDKYIYTFVFYANVEEELLNRIKKDGQEEFEVISTTGIRELAQTKHLSPEILDIIDFFPQGSTENSMRPHFVEITKDDLINPKNTNCKLNAFINSEITESDQLVLYASYLEATFPYLKMDENLMTSFMNKLGITPFSSDHFRSADIHNVGYVDFRGVLGFIATLKGARHKEKTVAGQRCR